MSFKIQRIFSNQGFDYKLTFEVSDKVLGHIPLEQLDMFKQEADAHIGERMLRMCLILGILISAGSENYLSLYSIVDKNLKEILDQISKDADKDPGYKQ